MILIFKSFNCVQIRISFLKNLRHSNFDELTMLRKINLLMFCRFLSQSKIKCSVNHSYQITQFKRRMIMNEMVSKNSVNAFTRFPSLLAVIPNKVEARIKPVVVNKVQARIKPLGVNKLQAMIKPVVVNKVQARIKRL